MRDVFNYSFCKANNSDKVDCIHCMRFYRDRYMLAKTNEYLSYLKAVSFYFSLLENKRASRSRYNSREIIEAKVIKDHWREKLKIKKACLK